ncbi:TA system VapC family ribonuclease toxin [Microbacterium sp.]|uniref:TA system VapC family ribonuclease toxin n=1 Tax=Microbacterium sp. TaxID=51671 RepID=UPI0039E4F031
MTRRALLDVNVLVALSSPQHVHHDIAHEHFAQLSSWCTTPITETGLVRLLMTEAVVGARIDGTDAVAQVRAFRAAPGWSWLADDVSPTQWRIGVDVLRGRQHVTDLQLVNVAAANDCVLATFDARIRRALRPSERRWVNVWA